MKTNKKTIQSAMDNRLSFLDEQPSCRTAVQIRIAQEEEPVMKKKISFSLVFAMVLTLLAAAGLAAGLLLSPRAEAMQIAERALEEKYGVTAEMQTFFAREQKEAEDGAVQITFSGAGCLDWVLGTYTAVVKDGKAEVTWSHDGEDTSRGYEAEAWGAEQLKAMVSDSRDTGLKKAYMARAEKLSAAHTVPAEVPDLTESEIEAFHARREADKTAALNACKIPEEEMIATAREFICSNWPLTDEQISWLDLLNGQTGPDNTAEANEWYEMVDGKPCYMVEYLLYRPLTTEQITDSNFVRTGGAGEGYYQIYINVENGEIEKYEYNSALGGIG